MQLVILNYNNYYNRIIKKETTLSDYLQYELYSFDDVNFNPNDGITATHIVGGNTSYDGKGDYMLVIEDNIIVYRWYIVEAVRTRAGQWKLELRRDVVADYMEAVLVSPCFIEKATLPPSDPFIYNSEEMTFNRIKTPYNANNNELLLKDKTQTAWLIGYYARTTGEDITTLSGTITGGTRQINILTDGLSNWEYNKYTTENFIYAPYVAGYSIRAIRNIYNEYEYIQNAQTNYYITNNDDMSVYTVSYDTIQTPVTQLMQPVDVNDITAEQVQEAFTGLKNDMKALALNYVNGSDDLDALMQLQGQYIQDTTDNRVYSIQVDKIPGNSTADIYIETTAGTQSNTIFGLMARKAQEIGFSTVNGYINAFTITGNVVEYYRITLTEVTTELESVSYNITSTRNHLQDAPYDMFAMPLTGMTFTRGTESVYIQTDTEINKLVMSDILERYGTTSGGLYDAQVVPYCPVLDILPPSVGAEVDLAQLSATDYSLITKTVAGATVNVGVIFNAKKSSFSTYIPLGENAIEVQDKKIENECDSYRICSPNFNSAFEFNVAKNDGLRAVNVYCTYYPFNPYIQVAPEFNGLYGQSYNDSRGLICGGDFSLTIVNDSWRQYQLQNKNYINSFERTIDNMEVQHRVQREQQIWGAVAGTGVGAVAGATLGGAVGGAFGGIASGLGGARDYILSDRLRNEAIDYTRDQFGYQLGNIKALPDSIKKLSAITVNNRLFPFIEYYTCTNQEKEALRSKIKYNGMTVMRIGTIQEFRQSEPTYIKGKLIRLEDIGEDYHVINTIAGEIYKGVFI